MLAPAAAFAGIYRQNIQGSRSCCSWPFARPGVQMQLQLASVRLRAELPSAAAARAALLQGYQSTQVVAGRDPCKFAMPAMGHIAVRNVPQAPTIRNPCFTDHRRIQIFSP